MSCSNSDHSPLCHCSGRHESFHKIIGPSCLSKKKSLMRETWINGCWNVRRRIWFHNSEYSRLSSGESEVT